jgi:thiol-disulfide isomerase/thioredoxin
MRALASFALIAAAAGAAQRPPATDSRAIPASALTAERRPAKDSQQPAILGSAGAIRLYTLDERSVMLSEYGAPVTVLALWATWCKPCLEELPYVEQLYQLYKGDPDVSIIAISIDHPARMESVRIEVQRLELSMPVLVDAERGLRRLLSRPDVVPTLVFIDRNFEMVQETGFNPLTANDFVAEKRGSIEIARARQPRHDGPRSVKQHKGGEVKVEAEPGQH